MLPVQSKFNQIALGVYNLADYRVRVFFAACSKNSDCKPWTNLGQTLPSKWSDIYISLQNLSLFSCDVDKLAFRFNPDVLLRVDQGLIKIENQKLARVRHICALAFLEKGTKV